MTMTAVKNEKDRKVRYNIKVKPGAIKLVAEFDENQTELLGQFIDLLLPENRQGLIRDDSSSNYNEFAFITRE